MAWDDVKSPGDLILSSDYNDGVTDQKTRSLVTSGAGAPATTPGKAGDIYVDTTSVRFYVAGGTSSSADWKEVLST